MKECKKVEKTANKDRQFFQQGEKVKVFHCPPVSAPISTPLKLCIYLVPFLRYSASNNGVTLK